MLKAAKLGIAIAAVLALIVPAAFAGVPDLTQSYYVPQAGNTTTPLEGPSAVVFFRACPDNDGGASLPNNARVKVIVKDVNGNPIAGIAAADICLLFNGGTAAQGFSGVGADSVIANSTWNQTPLCPDVRCVQADAPTDVNGIAYITLTGGNPTTPGVALRNGNRKWGHYDSEIPVYVLGFKLPGYTTTAKAAPYTLRIKNFDATGGLGAALNQGEAVTTTDFNLVAANLGKSNVLTYWIDFDSNGAVSTTDYNVMGSHFNHNCSYPLNP
jgi:hypothetical protein